MHKKQRPRRVLCFDVPDDASPRKEHQQKVTDDVKDGTLSHVEDSRFRVESPYGRDGDEFAERNEIIRAFAILSK
jgi:hypothetical protein